MGSEDEDMTLQLVDDLLRHIVSFLPVKDALRMSVLSTRWRYLWTCVSKIDLDDSIPFRNRPPDYPHCRTSFLHFVDRLLLGHDDSDITRFKLCLKSLNLSRIEFLNEDSTKELFSELSCIFPSLVELSLLRCRWKNINNLEIISSTLKSITMVVCDNDSLDCVVAIVAPELAKFCCETDGSILIFLEHSTSFLYTFLNYHPGGDEQVDAYERVEVLLGEIQNSIWLTVSTEALLASSDVPVFQGLIYLDIFSFVKPTTVESILGFMHKAPNLEYLLFNLENDDDDMDDWRSADPVPGCPLYKLSTLKVQGLDAVEVEMYLIKVFLENAPNLKRVKVNAHKRNARKLETVRNEILDLPRSSENCEFFFEVAKMHTRS